MKGGHDEKETHEMDGKKNEKGSRGLKEIKKRE